jgi:type II secretory pathway pseudopilin PulG
MDYRQQILKSSSRGMTLVEAVVATAIAGLLLAGFAQVLLSQNYILNEETLETRAETNLRTALDGIAEELRDAAYVQLKYNGTPNHYSGDEFKFNIPEKDTGASVGRVKLDTTNFSQIWGYGVPGNFDAGGTATLKFIPSTNAADIVREAAAPATNPLPGVYLNQDIDHDGAKTQTFTPGRLELYWNHPAGCQHYPASATVTQAFVRQLGGVYYTPTGAAKMFYRQVKEPFTDTNSNGIRDTGEAFQDLNGNGDWESTGDDFTDNTGNETFSSNATILQSDNNKTFDSGLLIQVLYIDPDTPANRIKFGKTLVQFQNMKMLGR